MLFVLFQITHAFFVERALQLTLTRVSTGRIQFDMRTVYQIKIADFVTINRISIELRFHAI